MVDNTTETFYKQVILKNKKLRELELKPLESISGNMNNPCKFSTKYGEVLKIPSDLKRGRGVSLKSAINKEEYFINMCKEIHGDKYDYSLARYSGHRIKVQVICKTHGKFEQDPFNILVNKSGCNKCSRNIPNIEEFISKANMRHSFKYDYSGIKYIDMTTPVDIKCNSHGYFSQKPYNHLRAKYGCRKCFLEEGAMYYSLKSARENKEKWKRTKAILYVIKLNNEDEEFYKIGVSTKSVKRRFGKSFEKNTGYSIKVISVKESNLYEAFIEENKTIRKNREHKYIPKTKFGGSTECFHINPMDVRDE